MSLNIGKYEMLGNYMWGGVDGIVDYLNQNMKTKQDTLFLKNFAKAIGSDTDIATKYAPTISGLDNFFGSIGPYYGQHLEVYRDKGDFITKLHKAQDFERMGVEAPPNMLDMYLGFAPNNMPINEIGKNVSYPWAEGDVYDLKPYGNFQGFDFPNENVRDVFWSQVNNLEPGGVMEIPGDVREKFYSSIDLGASYRTTIGKDKSGQPFVSVADIWDFGGQRGDWGEIMEMAGHKPINLYGRFPIAPQENYNTWNPYEPVEYGPESPNYKKTR